MHCSTQHWLAFLVLLAYMSSSPIPTSNPTQSQQHDDSVSYHSIQYQCNNLTQRLDLAGALPLLVRSTWEGHSYKANRCLWCLVTRPSREACSYQECCSNVTYGEFNVSTGRVLIGSGLSLIYILSRVHRIDDVQDDAVLRRAVPVAHSIFGVPQTINSANYVYFLALQELLKLNQPHMITIYTEELINLHRGQGIELFWRDSRQCPTEEEYIDMVNNSKYAWTLMRTR